MWASISPEFYATFWSLSMYDIHVPVEQYEVQKRKVQGLIKALESSDPDRKKKEDKFNKTLKKLDEEKTKQLSHHKLVLERCKVAKDKWLDNTPARNLTVRTYYLIAFL